MPAHMTTPPPLSIDSLVARLADNPRALARLARALAARGDDARARALTSRALAQAPTDAEVNSLAAEVMNWGVPDWHFGILQDAERNAAYDAALRRAIGPQTRVLEIGAGSGLLAMMAARAGAAQVVTCEQQLTLVEVATDIIARNGFAERVRVVAKHSRDLDVERDLGGPADLLVSEIVSNDLVAEDALPAIEQAARRLLKPGACMIPARGTIRVALAEDREAARHHTEMVAGFDLSAFDRLRPHRYRIPAGAPRLVLRSEPADLFTFDFQSGGPFPEGRAAVTLRSPGGPVNGIVQWIHLALDESTFYENRPRAGAVSAWAVLLYPLKPPLQAQPDVPVNVHGMHDRHSLHVWAERPGGRKP
jgi:protein arginine N-methyltransferase 7